MSENKSLTQKQRYLQFLIPKLDDTQIEKMIAAVNGKPTAILQPITSADRAPSPIPTPETPAEDPYRDMMDMIGCEDAKQQLSAPRDFVLGSWKSRWTI